ncbi:YciI family protein [bacterium]|nr:MAG: YciI family protein [bacterium]
MRVMVFVKATADTEAGVMPSTEQFEAMSDFNRQLVEAGVLLMGEGLKPSASGKRVRIDGSKRFVTDGPFAETKEVVAGFSIWRVKDLDEAMEWVQKCPNPMSGPCDIEIRPLFELEDWGDVVTPELAEQEGRFQPPLGDY